MHRQPSIRDQAQSFTEHDLAAAAITIANKLASGTYEMLVLIGEVDARRSFVLSGSLSTAAWLADLCDIDHVTARSQVRVARAMRSLDVLDAAVRDGELSYSKARVLVPHLTTENVVALVDLAARVPASRLGQEIATWSQKFEDPEDTSRRQFAERSVSWRTDADGMVTITARLPPESAAGICALIDQAVMVNHDVQDDPEPDVHKMTAGTAGSAPAGAGTDRGTGTSCSGRRRLPSLAQQRADCFVKLMSGTVTGFKSAGDASRSGGAVAEVIFHVRGDHNTLADGTPVSDHAVARLLPDAFVSLLIHDMHRYPIDASPRQRMPTRRQQRVLDQRFPTCAQEGCSAEVFLQYDHKRSYAHGGPTILDNLQRLCGPHNREKG